MAFTFIRAAKVAKVVLWRFILKSASQVDVTQKITTMMKNCKLIPKFGSSV